MAFQQDYKLADYFSVIGLDEELKPMTSGQEGKFSLISNFNNEYQHKTMAINKLKRIKSVSIFIHHSIKRVQS